MGRQREQHKLFLGEDLRDGLVPLLGMAALMRKGVAPRVELHPEVIEVAERARREEGMALDLALDLPQPIAVVVPEDQRVERVRPDRVAANDEFLPAVDSHLLPGTRSQATLVPAVEALRHKTFKALGFHGLSQYGKRRRQRACVLDRISQSWKNLAFQKLPPCRQRLVHDVLTGEHREGRTRSTRPAPLTNRSSAGH